MPLIMIAIAAPYVMIYLLTGYNSGQSTQAQRTWITSSMVLNQIFWALPFFIPALGPIVKVSEIITKVPVGGGGLATRIKVWLESPDHALLGMFLYTMVISVPTIGSFVVGQMMLNDQTLLAAAATEAPAVAAAAAATAVIGAAAVVTAAAAATVASAAMGESANGQN
ncbi:hypothetical protein DFP73DRAFT_596167 [Morchella snyderi]|nr:hypothetical protein DFP73DRAFT_596167 [Morchella snyderi]